jgi:hypothetical protein
MESFLHSKDDDEWKEVNPQSECDRGILTSEEGNTHNTYYMTS